MFARQTNTGESRRSSQKTGSAPISSEQHMAAVLWTGAQASSLATFVRQQPRRLRSSQIRAPPKDASRLINYHSLVGGTKVIGEYVENAAFRFICRQPSRLKRGFRNSCDVFSKPDCAPPKNLSPRQIVIPNDYSVGFLSRGDKLD
jgi:hypothetical protein